MKNCHLDKEDLNRFDDSYQNDLSNSFEILSNNV